MPVAPSHHLRVNAEDDVLVVTLLDRHLSDAVAAAAGNELYRLVEGRDRPRLRVDLGRVEHLTSTALGKLVGLNQRVRTAGGALTVENVRPFPFEVFEVTRLTRVLDVRPQETAAGAA
jgi:anti-sigma B factor antagonist